MFFHTYIYSHSWYQGLLNMITRAFTTYQYWVARFLNPQHYGQAPHCYATMQQVCAPADQPSERATSGLAYLDRLAAQLEGLSDVELSALIARLDAKNGLSWAAAIRTMSDVDLDAFMTTLETAIRQPGWARRLVTALRAHAPEALPEREQR